MPRSCPGIHHQCREIHWMSFLSVQITPETSTKKADYLGLLCCPLVCASCMSGSNPHRRGPIIHLICKPAFQWAGRQTVSFWSVEYNCYSTMNRLPCTKQVDCPSSNKGLCFPSGRLGSPNWAVHHLPTTPGRFLTAVWLSDARWLQLLSCPSRLVPRHSSRRGQGQSLPARFALNPGAPLVPVCVQALLHGHIWRALIRLPDVAMVVHELPWQH